MNGIKKEQKKETKVKATNIRQRSDHDASKKKSTAKTLTFVFESGYF